MFYLPKTIHPHLYTMLQKETMSEEKKQEVVLELSKDIYLGKTDEEAWRIFHDPTASFIANNREATGGELHEWVEKIGQKFLADGTKPQQLKNAVVQKIVEVKAIYGLTYKFDPNDAEKSPKFAEMTAEAIAYGMISQEQLDSFKNQFISNKSVSPAERIFNSDEAVIELQEIAECR